MEGFKRLEYKWMLSFWRYFSVWELRGLLMEGFKRLEYKWDAFFLEVF